MVARGHGIETLCLYLALARGALLNFIVALGLPTPHDRPHRRAGGRTPWSLEHIAQFIPLWEAGWRAGALAERFGRKPGAIWSKARQLGLARRDRKVLVTPEDPHVPLSAALAVSRCSAPQNPLVPRAEATLAPVAAPDVSHAADCLAHATPASADGSAQLLPDNPSGSAIRHEPVPDQVPSARGRDIGSSPIAVPGFEPARPLIQPPTPAPAEGPVGSKRTRGPEFEWTPPGDRELALRFFSGQYIARIASEMGISEAAALSRKTRLGLSFKWLGISRTDRGTSVPHFDERRALAFIARFGLVCVPCLGYKQHGIDLRFWCRRKDAAKVRFSPGHNMTKEGKARRSSAAI
jgi:hypothetical protein